MSSEPWCRLRRISVHQDLAKFALCHHWTASNPSLPQIKPDSGQDSFNLQLELDKGLEKSFEFNLDDL